MKILILILFCIPFTTKAQQGYPHIQFKESKHPTDSVAKYKLFFEKARYRVVVTLSPGEKARWETIETVYWQETAYWSHELADSVYKAKPKG